MTAYFVLTVQAKCPWAPCASATEIKQSMAADFWGGDEAGPCVLKSIKIQGKISIAMK